MDIESIKAELRIAHSVLSKRCLKVAASWVAELLCNASTRLSPSTRAKAAAYSFGAAEDEGQTWSDPYRLAHSYVECRQYLRAAHVLDTKFAAAALTCEAPYPPDAFFLRCYAMYLDGERQREGHRTEAAAVPSSVLASKAAVNPHLQGLATVLSEGFLTKSLDAFGLYIYAVVLRNLKREKEAQTVFLESITAYPFNWSAWLDLGKTLRSAKEVEALAPRLPQHWMSDVFRGHAYVELQANAAALEVYRPLAAFFPSSSYLQAQVGKALYNLRHFSEAQRLLQGVQARDPHRMEDLDVLSNILYVAENKAALSSLAHAAWRANKYRPESCCILGNYCSLRGESEKAILYFRRALRLKADYHSAWTLMGHEYLELKNDGAAIECYRHAVQADPRDYRAWYGLGQTYELLQLYHYSAYYYRRAAALRPYDVRMSCALGSVYEQLQRPREAIACYSRACAAAGAASAAAGGAAAGGAAGVTANKDGGIAMALLRLAKLHRRLGETAEACKAYASYVEAMEATAAAAAGASAAGAAAPLLPGDADLAEAVLFLAQQALQQQRLDDAETYAGRVAWGMQQLEQEVKEAKELLREVQLAKAAKLAVERAKVALAAGGGAAAGAAGQGSISASRLNLRALLASPAGGVGSAAAGMAAGGTRVEAASSAVGAAASPGPAAAAVLRVPGFNGGLSGGVMGQQAHPHPTLAITGNSGFLAAAAAAASAAAASSGLLPGATAAAARQGGASVPAAPAGTRVGAGGGGAGGAAAAATVAAGGVGSALAVPSGLAAQLAEAARVRPAGAATTAAAPAVAPAHPLPPASAVRATRAVTFAPSSAAAASPAPVASQLHHSQLHYLHEQQHEMSLNSTGMSTGQSERTGRTQAAMQQEHSSIMMSGSTASSASSSASAPAYGAMRTAAAGTPASAAVRGGLFSSPALQEMQDSTAASTPLHAGSAATAAAGADGSFGGSGLNSSSHDLLLASAGLSPVLDSSYHSYHAHAGGTGGAGGAGARRQGAAASAGRAAGGSSARGGIAAAGAHTYSTGYPSGTPAEEAEDVMMQDSSSLSQQGLGLGLGLGEGESDGLAESEGLSLGETSMMMRGALRGGRSAAGGGMEDSVMSAGTAASVSSAAAMAAAAAGAAFPSPMLNSSHNVSHTMSVGSAASAGRGGGAGAAEGAGGGGGGELEDSFDADVNDF